MAEPTDLPDLRALAVEALDRADLLDLIPLEYRDMVLDAALSVLPTHRDLVLDEIARHFDDAALAHGHLHPRMCHYTEIAAEVRRLAATTPAAGLSASVEPEVDPAVPGTATRSRMSAMAERAEARRATSPDYPDSPEHVAEQSATTEALGAWQSEAMRDCGQPQAAESAPAVGREAAEAQGGAEAVPLETLTEELGATDPVFRAAAERTELIDRLRIDIAIAIVRAGVDLGDDDATDLFEWHECVDEPNCSVVRDGQPCACAGIPYLSDAVWAQVGPILSQVTRERDEWKRRATELQPAAIHERESLRSENARLRGRIAALDARPLFSTRWVMQALLCAVGDPVDEHALIKRIDGGLTLADVAELAVAAINEPCHDLEAFERQAAELAKLRIQVQAGACPHTEAIGELHLKWLAEVADLKQRILDIDAHATPYGDIPDEPGWVGTYLVTAGALHRALGKVGHSAPKCEAEAERDRLADAIRRYVPVIEAVKAWRAARPGPWTGGADVEFGLLCAVDALGEVGADPGGEQKTAHPPAGADIRTGPDTLSWADAAARVSADAQEIEASREDLAEREGQRYVDLADETGDDRG